MPSSPGRERPWWCRPRQAASASWPRSSCGLRGATVVGTAGGHNLDFLRSLGIVPLSHGPGLAEEISKVAPEGVDAYIDTFGGATSTSPSRSVSRHTGSTPWPTPWRSAATACTAGPRRTRSPLCWSPSWPTWSPAAGWPCRSTRCIRWNGSARPMSSRLGVTPEARSCLASFPRPTASGSAGPCSVTGPATRRRARQPQLARGGPWPPGRRPASAWIGAL